MPRAAVERLQTKRTPTRRQQRRVRPARRAKPNRAHRRPRLRGRERSQGPHTHRRRSGSSGSTAATSSAPSHRPVRLLVASCPWREARPSLVWLRPPRGTSDTARFLGYARVFSTAGASGDARRMSIVTETPLLTRAEIWRELGQQLRVDAIRATAVTQSGHPTSAMSAADLIAVLAEKYLRYDFDRPDDPNNDHLIFSKGHASPPLYALYKAVGAISDEELLTTRLLGSPLEGHPSPALPWVDVATGSLGFGLPVGVGIALAAKTLDARPYRVWVLAGDSFV